MAHLEERDRSRAEATRDFSDDGAAVGTGAAAELIANPSTTEIRPVSRDLSGEREAPCRVWLLTNAPSPYQCELFSAIADRTDLQLNVRFMRPESSSGKTLARRFESCVMTGLAPRSWRDEFRIHPGGLSEVAFGNYNVFVLSGLYTSLTFLFSAAILHLRGKPWAVWLERPHPERSAAAAWSPRWLMSRPARWMRRLIMSRLLNSAHQVICIGTAARDAYQQLTNSADRLQVLPYCCDTHRYESVEEEQIEAIRTRDHLHDRTVFLYSGQLIDRKRVDTALAAFGELANRYPRISLLLLGDGPKRRELEQSVPECLRPSVHFIGHVDQSELPAYFRAVDVFVFPSRHDGWGVVVNEACAAGLPVVTTHQTGAAKDLVRDGESGFVLERDDVAGFARAMEHFLIHPEDIAGFGARSRELVRPFSAENGAERFSRIMGQLRTT